MRRGLSGAAKDEAHGTDSSLQAGLLPRPPDGGAGRTGSGSEFTAQTDEFRRFALDMAMQIAATDPLDVDALLAQRMMRDPVTVSERLAELARNSQERIVITRFVRWSD